MKIDYIRTFLEIFDCGNFNRAAENLHVTQSTVSARVKAMEDRFGRVLFKRGHSGSIGNINTLFSLFHQVKKEIHDAVQPWSIESESPLCAVCRS